MTRAARQQMRKLDNATATALRRKIDMVAKSPSDQHKWFGKLTNRPAFKIRQGNFRAIVTIRDGTLTILAIDLRKEAYR